MRRKDYGIAVGNAANFVVIDATDAVDGLKEIALTLMGYKDGRRTYARERARLLRPAPLEGATDDDIASRCGAMRRA